MTEKIVRVEGNRVVVWGKLPSGVYTSPSGAVYISHYECAVPEQAYMADFDISQFATCLSYGIVIYGSPAVGEALSKAEEKCGGVGCGATPVDSDVLFARRHTAIIGGTGSGKTTLIMRAIEAGGIEGRVVVLAYHTDLLELSRLPHVEVITPTVDICDLDYQSLFMLLQFHRLSAEPVKMQRYLRMLHPVACEAARRFGLPSHEALLLLLRLLVMLEPIEMRCRGALVGNSEESLYCKLRKLLEEALGSFKYNVVKDLAKGRDADSLNSLLMYAEMAFANGLGETRILGDKPVTVLDITPSLSLVTGALEGRLASLLSILFANKVKTGGEPLYVVIDEFAALSSVPYIHDVFKLLLMQGRKFGIYLIAAGQPDPSVYDLLPNFHRVILGRIAGSRAIRELAAGLPNVPSEILRSLPALKPLEMVSIDHDRIIPFKVLHPSWRHV
ncbi:MAG: hypothetical protein QXN04_11390 [Pyrobaculum sp.]